MPFDAVSEQLVQSRIIDEMLCILGPNGEHWIKGSEVGTKNVCLLHALNIAQSNLGVHGNEMHRRIVEAINIVEGRYMQIPDFNDEPDRTFADVLTVLELSLTVRLSEASTKLWAAYVNPAALVEAIIRAEQAFKAEHKKKRRKVAAEIGTACGAALLMLAAISIPI